MSSWVPRGLSADDAARYVGFSTSGFRSVVAKEVPAVRLTERRVIWLKDDLDRWLDRKAGKQAESGDFLTDSLDAAIDRS